MMIIVTSAMLLVVGTLLLIGAATYLLKGLIGVSAHFAVPTFILSMLVISIDLEVFAPAVVGAYNDLTELSYGSILGTVVFLICLALGVAAFLYPLQQVAFPVRYVGLLGGALVSNVLFGLDGQINRLEGAVCIILYGAYLMYLIRDVRRTRSIQRGLAEGAAEVEDIRDKPLYVSVLAVVGGLIFLVAGGLAVVAGIGNLLLFWGISETIMGVTVLAIAANSVELVEAVIPAQKDMGEVVVGNIVGSAVFQVLFTTGFVALVRPVQVEPVAFQVAMPAALLSWLVLLVLVAQQRVSRLIGGTLVLAYILFVGVSVVLGLAL